MIFPCQRCLQPVEFDDERRGEAVRCPICGRWTKLGMAPEKSETRRPIRWGRWLTTGLLLALIGFILYVINRALTDLRISHVEAMGAYAQIVLSLLILAALVWTVFLWVIFPVFVFHYMRRMNRNIEALRRKLCE